MSRWTALRSSNTSSDYQHLLENTKAAQVQLELSEESGKEQLLGDKNLVSGSERIFRGAIGGAAFPSIVGRDFSWAPSEITDHQIR